MDQDSDQASSKLFQGTHGAIEFELVIWWNWGTDSETGITTSETFGHDDWNYGGYGCGVCETGRMIDVDRGGMINDEGCVNWVANVKQLVEKHLILERS